ncbi:hypothetical protein D9757_014002 [Collybiopsis confluens]|uniref:Uncharacterized protein n=1 Tax=Collybiopsis confluens TaxID=2823264 RepID=A0A8H5HJL2_9AGAR|nr:hypothetical protein D9757_014002 [Collybiopsis confluens]
MLTNSTEPASEQIHNRTLNWLSNEHVWQQREEFALWDASFQLMFFFEPRPPSTWEVGGVSAVTARPSFLWITGAVTRLGHILCCVALLDDTIPFVEAKSKSRARRYIFFDAVTRGNESNSSEPYISDLRAATDSLIIGSLWSSVVVMVR